MMTKKIIIDIETTGLEPWTDRIICIGCKDTETEEIIIFYDVDEVELLKKFLNYFHEKEFVSIIGYNVLFDIRFIFGRVLKFGIPANGFFKTGYEDLMMLLKSVGYRYSYNKPGKLSNWADLLFEHGKIELEDSIDELYNQGRIKEILDYNFRDVEITHMLWKRIKEVLG